MPHTFRSLLILLLLAFLAFYAGPVLIFSARSYFPPKHEGDSQSWRITEWRVGQRLFGLTLDQTLTTGARQDTGEAEKRFIGWQQNERELRLLAVDPNDNATLIYDGSVFSGYVTRPGRHLPFHLEAKHNSSGVSSQESP